eukprot:361279-Chlamydomonas_euryale.AAC.5
MGPSLGPGGARTQSGSRRRDAGGGSGGSGWASRRDVLCRVQPTAACTIPLRASLSISRPFIPAKHSQLAKPEQTATLDPSTHSTRTECMHGHMHRTCSDFPWPPSSLHHLFFKLLFRLSEMQQLGRTHSHTAARVPTPPHTFPHRCTRSHTAARVPTPLHAFPHRRTRYHTAAHVTTPLHAFPHCCLAGHTDLQPSGSAHSRSSVGVSSLPKGSSV